MTMWWAYKGCAAVHCSNYNNYAFLFVSILLEILFRLLNSRLECPFLVHFQLGFLFNRLAEKVTLAELFPVLVRLLYFSPFRRHMILARLNHLLLLFLLGLLPPLFSQFLFHLEPASFLNDSSPGVCAHGGRFRSLFRAFLQRRWLLVVLLRGSWRFFLRLLLQGIIFLLCPEYSSLLLFPFDATLARLHVRESLVKAASEPRLLICGLGYLATTSF